MKILYDHHIFTNQKFGGISRYFVEMFNQFDKMADINYILSSPYSVNFYLLNSGRSKEFVPKLNFKGKKEIISYLNNYFLINRLRKAKFDLIHPTYYDPFFLKFIENKNFVLTVHDMTHELLKEYLPKNDTTSEHKKHLVDKAARIIAVSENTKNDLVRLWNVDADKIDVIYHGNSMKVNGLREKVEGVPDDYILYVGARHQYKNFQRFIHAVTPLLHTNRNFSIVCAGGKPITNSETVFFKESGIEKQIVQLSIDDQMLSRLYSNAKLFVFPSLYEGFGIPLLEAFACRCPIACSGNSCFPEIAGEAAMYFDPFSIDSMRQVIQEMIDNSVLREKLSLKGEKQLLNFSWEKTAFETQEAYKKCL